MTNGIKFPTATHIMQWIGIEPEVSQTYQTILPCTNTVSINTTYTEQEAQTLQLPKHILDSYEPCGKNIYCANCHALINRAGKAWHVTAATHLIIDILCTTIYHIQHNNMPKHDITQEIHHCSNNCKLVTTIEQQTQTNPTFQRKQGWKK